MKDTKLVLVRKFLVLSCFCAVFAISTACTREETKSGSQIRMALSPSLSKAGSNGSFNVGTGYFPAHLIANVHYDGKTEIDHWDCKELEGEDGNPLNCHFPPYIDFKGKLFPQGADRSIQVLIVFSNEEDNLLFAYDDEVGVNFNEAEVTVNIGDNWLQQGGGKQGQVAGRHASLKTGPVVGSFQPPRPGRPSMALFEEFMFSGWFQFMFFEGVNLTYEIVPLNPELSPTPLFVDKQLGDIKAQLQPNKAGAALSIPTFYTVREEEMNSTEYYSDRVGSEEVIVGFFNSAGEVRNNNSLFSILVPTEDIPHDLMYRKVINGEVIDPIDGTSKGFVNPSTQVPGASKSDWDQYTVDFSYSDPTDTNHIIKIAGLSSATGACSGVSDTNLVTNKCIKLIPEFAKEHQIVPFDGPFEVTKGSYGPEVLTNIDSNTVGWKFLPGVAGNSVNGLAFFIIDKDERFHEDTPCYGLAKKANISGLPFKESESNHANLPQVFQSVVKAVTTTNGSHSFGGNLQGKQALACPFALIDGKKYFSNVSADNHGFHSGPPPMTKSIHLGDTTTGGTNAGNQSIVDSFTLGDGTNFLLGKTDGAGFISAGFGSTDLFVIKINAQGDHEWMKRYGSSGSENPRSLTIDGSDIYITGETSGDFGGVNAGSADGFILKLNVSDGMPNTSFGDGDGANGDGVVQLNAVNTVNATGTDSLSSIVVTPVSIYVAGYTSFYMGGASATGADAYIAKLNKSTGTLDADFGDGDGANDDGIVQVNTTNTGQSTGAESVGGILANGAGSLFLWGYTNSYLSNSNGGTGTDGFVIKLDEISGVFDPSFGDGDGTDDDGIVQFNANNLSSGASSSDYIVSGSIIGSDLLLAGTTMADLGGTQAGSGDIFILKIDQIDGLLNSSFGSGDGTPTDGVLQINDTLISDASGIDELSDMKVTGNGEIIITGQTRSSMFDTNGGDYDVYVAKINANDGSVIWGTQLGQNVLGVSQSSATDYGKSLDFNVNGNIFIGGSSNGDFHEAATSEDAFFLTFDSDGTFSGF